MTEQIKIDREIAEARTFLWLAIASFILIFACLPFEFILGASAGLWLTVIFLVTYRFKLTRISCSHCKNAFGTCMLPNFTSLNGPKSDPKFNFCPYCGLETG